MFERREKVLRVLINPDTNIIDKLWVPRYKGLVWLRTDSQVGGPTVDNGLTAYGGGYGGGLWLGCGSNTMFERRQKVLRMLINPNTNIIDN